MSEYPAYPYPPRTSEEVFIEGVKDEFFGE